MALSPGEAIPAPGYTSVTLEEAADVLTAHAARGTAEVLWLRRPGNWTERIEETRRAMAEVGRGVVFTKGNVCAWCHEPTISRGWYFPATGTPGPVVGFGACEDCHGDAWADRGLVAIAAAVSRCDGDGFEVERMLSALPERCPADAVVVAMESICPEGTGRAACT